jgi:hypothetical protein
VNLHHTQGGWSHMCTQSTKRSSSPEL